MSEENIFTPAPTQIDDVMDITVGQIIEVALRTPDESGLFSLDIELDGVEGTIPFVMSYAVGNQAVGFENFLRSMADEVTSESVVDRAE